MRTKNWGVKIRVAVATRAALKALGKKGDSYDMIINELITFKEAAKK